MRSTLERTVPALSESGSYIGLHSRSFRMASRFFPKGERKRIERLYAFCRVTDDIADAGDLPVAERLVLLDGWWQLAEAAYNGEPTGIEVLDALMFDTASSGVSLRYARELVEGVRMDLRGTRYGTMEELDLYCYRVASVVGLWITELAGIDDPAVLDRAAAMGRAMQLTNIARDVGADLRMGRVYLPGRLLHEHGVGEDTLKRLISSQAPIPETYANLVEEILHEAEAGYALALPAVRQLPRSYRAPVAVAARVYRGIHESIRANGYDNLRKRAFTTPWRKALLAIGAVPILTPQTGRRDRAPAEDSRALPRR